MSNDFGLQYQNIQNQIQTASAMNPYFAHQFGLTAGEITAAQFGVPTMNRQTPDDTSSDKLLLLVEEESE